jgi:hypothetical protein
MLANCDVGVADQVPLAVQPAGILDHPDIDHVPLFTVPVNEIVTAPLTPDPVTTPFASVKLKVPAPGEKVPV